MKIYAGKNLGDGNYIGAGMSPSDAWYLYVIWTLITNPSLIIGLVCGFFLAVYFIGPDNPIGFLAVCTGSGLAICFVLKAIWKAIWKPQVTKTISKTASDPVKDATEPLTREEQIASIDAAMAHIEVIKQQMKLAESKELKRKFGLD